MVKRLSEYFERDEADSKVLAAKVVVDQLTPEQRQELFGYYCAYCGSDEPGCRCWDDE